MSEGNIFSLLRKLDYIRRIDESIVTNINTCYINFGSLVSVSCLMSGLYIASIQPMKLHLNYNMSKKTSFTLSTIIRYVFGLFWCLSYYHFIKYASYPMIDVEKSLFIPSSFSLIPATIRKYTSYFILLSTLILELKAMYDAGAESFNPQQNGKLHEGIYKYIRHPQAFGEWLIWFGISLYYDSPFLFLFSFFIYTPIWVLWCKQEEKDLLIRFGNKYEQYMKNTGFWFPNLNALFKQKRND
eukprot:501220_1